MKKISKRKSTVKTSTKPKNLSKIKKDQVEKNKVIKDLKKVNKNYKFKNYFSSETQLKDITHKSDPAKILEAYQRLIFVYANNHVREDVELEDLIAEGQKGICEAIKEANDPNRKAKNYNFNQSCLYKLRTAVYQYCLRNASQIKTPYYIQRGCMHVAQIFKLMTNQSTAEAVLGRTGPATEEEIVDFLYKEDERLPLKPLSFIKAQIIKEESRPEFKQILSGILKHELGSRHGYIKKNLTDVGKILHIKEKIWYTSSTNNMDYARVIDLILSARHSKTELNLAIYSPQYSDVEETAVRNELIERGRNLCGKEYFDIFLENKIMDKSYEEISKKYKIKKSTIVDVVKYCIKILKNDEEFVEAFKGMA